MHATSYIVLIEIRQAQWFMGIQLDLCPNTRIKTEVLLPLLALLMLQSPWVMIIDTLPGHLG